MDLLPLVSNKTISLCGAFATISLIVQLTIELLIIDTKYWNKWVSSNLDLSSNTLLVLFAAIVVYKIMLIF